MNKTEGLNSLKAQRAQSLERYYTGTKMREQAEKDLAVLDTSIHAMSIEDTVAAQAETPQVA